MDKLLLATNDPAVREAFAAVKWEELGFRAPRMVATVEDALASLKAHHADAVAVGLPQAEDDRLAQALLTEAPMLPIMQVDRDPARVERLVLELRRLLARVNADVTDEAFTAVDMLQVCRHEFFRELMDGKFTRKADVLRQLRLLRSKMDPTKPCVLAELSLPEKSDFLKGRWHYGARRLEVALRNIFGVEVGGLHILVCVLPGDRIFLLGCPMLWREGPDEDASITGIVSHHINDCIDHVGEFLGLDLCISSIRVLPDLTSLVQDQRL